VKAQIHRGAEEIGGSCVEVIATSEDRLVIDLGLPLEIGRDFKGPISSVAGLKDGDDPSLRGVLLTHAHPDHFGLIEEISAEVPIYMGEATSRILREASFFTPLGLDRKPAGSLVDRQPLQVGSFTVTPFLVDHSAFDSYALMVEADRRRLFYTGDLRAHGRKAALVDRLIHEPPRDVGTLLLEGTSVGRPYQGDTLQEQDVEQRCTDLFRVTSGMALACYSPQNVDRLVSVYKAAVRSGRSLVIDLYGAAIAAATGAVSIPQSYWDRIRVYVPRVQRVRVKESAQFWRVNDLGASRIFAEELAAEPDRWVMCFRQSMMRELEQAGCLREAQTVWLMWPGYLDSEAGQVFQASLASLGIDLTVIHASGHASIKDLQRFAAAIDAEKVVPIHTDAPERYSTLFDRVVRQPDEAWWAV
jgi:ribonuclease J